MAISGRPVSAATPHAPTQKLDALQSNVRSLQRGLKVLRLISRNSGIKAGEIAEQIGLARPTVYRLLETLEEEGYVVRSASDNRFRVTQEARSLGVGYDAVNSISQVAGPVLIELSQQFIWPFDMSVCHGAYMIVQESTHPRSPLSVDRGVIGRHLPMLRTAAGRCYLAHCPPAVRVQLLEQIENLKIPEDSFYLAASSLDRLLSETVERGYAVRYHEHYNSHTSSIAVPIFSGTTLVGSMAVIWITKAMTLVEGIDQFLETMREAARRITYRHDRMHADA
jgi:IclR family transcriptional regulator, mhp operon transcriptional activator